MSKLAAFKSRDTDRVNVNKWLDAIGETDKACRDEVMSACAADPDARAYFVAEAKKHLALQ